MKRLTVILLAIASLCGAVAAQADSVTFDYEPLNQFYGTPAAHLPGDYIFSEGGADLSIHQITAYPEDDVRAS